ncbi:hypothetical protein K461DRAFT_323143 [Myriangium duriaei CBS 260.36]|uniref:Protein phosphatase 4 core regulatory subunit R2 n=1 Tax=Myriangium duriaei CBS 260.36 TaxID=1168546 RepID=A0A9P4IZP1_9PEZI|nr:hypothetical protein K461DRAFT_323143 [Myriangium duriaei CBS 260.36]
MSTEQDILVSAARDGTLDVSEWPRVLENVLQRLHDIVHSEFPLPPKPTLPLQSSHPFASNAAAAPSIPEKDSSQAARPADSEALGELETPSQTSSGTNKENAAPLMPPPALTPSRSTNSSSQPGAQEEFLVSYPDLAASYQSSVHILKNSFATSPPYTIQRLAELVLSPRRHYRYLPSYLNALDRIVSVSSPITSFPLPQQPLTNGILQSNGQDDKFSSTSGDEGLGGALLTPIPWLRNQHQVEETTRHPDGELHTEGTETIDGPNGAGRVETVSVTVNGIHSTPHASTTPNGHHDPNSTLTTEQELREQGAVTQGELLRQEQEAGVVPVTQIAARRGLAGSRSGAMGPDMHASVEETEGEEAPHARGPEEIGMEDLGPQEGTIGAGRPLDLEAALGRSPEPAPAPEGTGLEQLQDHQQGQHEEQQHEQIQDQNQNQNQEQRQGRGDEGATEAREVKSDQMKPSEGDGMHVDVGEVVAP